MTLTNFVIQNVSVKNIPVEFILLLTTHIKYIINYKVEEIKSSTLFIFFLCDKYAKKNGPLHPSLWFSYTVIMYKLKVLKIRLIKKQK